MNTSTSSTILDYYARERETLATEPAVREELQALGVSFVHAEYDGVGDSGQIDEIRYSDGSDPGQSVKVAAPTHDRVEALLYALLALRYDGWENNDGGFGAFHWNLVEGTIEHQHSQRYTDHVTSVHQGFGAGQGEAP